MRKKFLILFASILLVGCGRDMSSVSTEDIMKECTDNVNKYSYVNIIYDKS